VKECNVSTTNTKHFLKACDGDGVKENKRTLESV